MNSTEPQMDVSPHAARLVTTHSELGEGPSLPVPPRIGGLRLLNLGQFLSLPKPEWLIPGVLPSHAVSILYAEPGALKSFLVLDVLLSLATGSSWAGAPLLATPVLYVAAEGGRGSAMRVNAWLHDRMLGCRVEDLPIRSVDSPVLIESGTDSDISIGALRKLLLEEEFTPRLIVFDTLSQCTPGQNENTQKDTSSMMFELQKFCAEFEAAVLLVHHATKNGSDLRGSSVITGAVHMVSTMDRNSDGTVDLVCEKQKDGPLFARIRFRPREVKDAESLVLDYVAHVEPKKVAPRKGGLSEDQQRVLDFFGGSPLKRRDVVAHFASASPPIPDKTVYKHLKSLEKASHIQPVAKGMLQRVRNE